MMMNMIINQQPQRQQRDVPEDEEREEVVGVVDIETEIMIEIVSRIDDIK